MNYIESSVRRLTGQYGTSDPFELCERLGVRLTILPLPPAIRGFYSNTLGMDFVYINQKLSNSEQRIVCAHELGHVVLHPGVNSLFVARSTLMSQSKLENQADLFAAHLLIPDTVFTGDGDDPLTLEQLSHRLKIPVEYLQLKYESLQQT